MAKSKKINYIRCDCGCVMVADSEYKERLEKAIQNFVVEWDKSESFDADRLRSKVGVAIQELCKISGEI